MIIIWRVWQHLKNIDLFFSLLLGTTQRKGIEQKIQWEKKRSHLRTPVLWSNHTNHNPMHQIWMCSWKLIHLMRKQSVVRSNNWIHSACSQFFVCAQYFVKSSKCAAVLSGSDLSPSPANVDVARVFAICLIHTHVNRVLCHSGRYIEVAKRVVYDLPLLTIQCHIMIHSWMYAVHCVIFFNT